MNQNEINRQVSRVTGESIREIRRRGFSVLPPQPPVFWPDADEWREPQMIDWNEVETRRYAVAT